MTKSCKVPGCWCALPWLHTFPLSMCTAVEADGEHWLMGFRGTAGEANPDYRQGCEDPPQVSRIASCTYTATEA